MCVLLVSECEWTEILLLPVPVVLLLTTQRLVLLVCWSWRGEVDDDGERRAGCFTCERRSAVENRAGIVFLPSSSSVRLREPTAQRFIDDS